MSFNQKVKAEICEGEICRGDAKILQEIFLNNGKAYNPENEYRLELTVRESCKSKVAGALAVFNLKFSEIKRGKSCIIYTKNSDVVEEFLTIIGAPNAAIDVMNAKIYKSVRARANRIRNFETANIARGADSAARQIVAIREIKNRGEWDKLSDDLKVLANLRLENPEASLGELAEMLEISRSAVDRRLRKIVDFAAEIIL